MALGNWSSLGLIDGRDAFTSPLGVEVEVYKNWIYVRDPAIRPHEHEPFAHNTVMEVRTGRVRYRDVYIHAMRGPQDGVYMVAGLSYEDPLAIACGVYGYDDRGEWIGVTDRAERFLKRWAERVKKAGAF